MEGSDVGGVSETLNWEKNVSGVIDRGEEDAAMNEEDESLADFDSGARMIASGFNRSDCADQTVGEARQLSTVSGQYEHDKKFWAAAVVNLEGKLKKMKDEHAQLSLEAHECADSVPELSQMSSAIQGLVAKCEDPKLKYKEELTKRRQLDWAQPLLLLCIGWMVASVVMPKEIRSKSPIIYDIITLLVALCFCNILVSFFISDRFLAAVKVVGMLSGLTAFFFATCIHLTPPLIITVFILYFLSVIAVVTSRLL